uniref:hypothetical protein n=1 Tax=Thaumasiovibrio occultus TaxID=1891184 RepID=UPI001863FEFB|nr:hypothetical protein [Thaumasiovibrio occultus]
MAVISTVLSVASLVTELGPKVLRAVGSLLGGKTERVADTLAQSIEEIDGELFSQEDRQAHIAEVIQSLPTEDLSELEKIKVELEKERNRRFELQVQDRQSEHRETQTTIRAGDMAEDPYVRRTRPQGARLSLYTAIIYTFLFEGLAAFDKGDGADVYILGLLIAPFMTYMGWRTADKFGYAKLFKAQLKEQFSRPLLTQK